MEALLHWSARNGRVLLVLGLLTGMLWQGAADFLKHYIAEMAVCLLFLAAFRVGPKAAIGAARDFKFALSAILVFQVVVPIILFFFFWMIGWKGVLPSALALLLSGASVSASPHLAVMVGHQPAPALRMLVLGTALLPITILPILWLMPEFGDAASVILPSLKLFAVIGLSALFAFFLRHRFFAEPSKKLIKSVDGLSSIFLYFIVVGLMSAVAPALLEDINLFLVTLFAAFAVNFGLQFLSFFVLRGERFQEQRVPASIVSGNRNMALFLTALPVSVTDPMLLFIGCYQIPMYLTPILLNPLYKLAKTTSG